MLLTAPPCLRARLRLESIDCVIHHVGYHRNGLGQGQTRVAQRPEGRGVCQAHGRRPHHPIRYRIAQGDCVERADVPPEPQLTLMKRRHLRGHYELTLAI